MLKNSRVAVVCKVGEEAADVEVEVAEVEVTEVEAIEDGN
jgi:hypothetical protein